MAASAEPVLQGGSYCVCANFSTLSRGFVFPGCFFPNRNMLVQFYPTGSSEPAYSLQNTVKQCWASFHKVTMRRKKRIGVVLKYIEKEKCVQYTGVKGLKEINETGLICQKGFKKFSIRVDFGSQVCREGFIFLPCNN